MSLTGLTLGLTKRLCNGLGGGVNRRSSSAPTYPTTDLIQAEIYPDGLTLSGSNVTGWTAAVGVNLTATGTVTKVANGVNFAASAALTHSNITIPANTPFTVILAGYRATSTSNWTLAGTSASNNPYIGIGGNAFYGLDNTGAPGYDGIVINTTGRQYLYMRRHPFGPMFVGGTGMADTVIGAYADYNSLVFTFNSVPRLLYDPYDATSGNMSRFIFAGASGDLVVSGEMANMVAYLVAKNGVAT